MSKRMILLAIYVLFGASEISLASETLSVENPTKLGVWQQMSVGCEDPANEVANYARKHLEESGISVTAPNEIEPGEPYLLVRLSCRGLPTEDRSAVFHFELTLATYTLSSDQTDAVVSMRLMDYSDIGQAKAGTLVEIGKEYIRDFVRDFKASNQL